MGRIAIKIGSNVLGREDGKLNIARLAALVDQIAELHRRGFEIILISSGAVASGCGEIGVDESLDKTSARQLYSAIGQAKLINRYYDFFHEYGILCGQVLTTKESFATPTHYQTQRHCMEVMLQHKVIPIVNENDTVSVTELMFTDNDELAGLIADMMRVDRLILLTNVKGIYDGDPNSPQSRVIPYIHPGESVEKYIQNTTSARGRGGMTSKYRIAQRTAEKGIPVVIADGKQKNILLALFDEKEQVVCTQFLANPKENTQPITAHTLIQEASASVSALQRLRDEEVCQILKDLRESLLRQTPDILEANRKDLERMSPENPKYDRLKLTEARIADMAEGVGHIAGLPSPLNHLLNRWVRPNGMEIRKVSVPFGVIGIIYEARPNVTTDVFALCLRSGNVCVLKGGSDASFTNQTLVQIIREVLIAHGVTPSVCTLLPSDREASGALLNAVGLVDLIIPRGSASLIRFVREQAHIPVIETGAGVCHTYFDQSGDVEIGKRIIYNAKTRRVSVCNALDCLIIHKNRLGDLPKLCAPLAEKNVRIQADADAFQVLKGNYPESLLQEATDSSFGTEFLDYVMSIRTVSSLQEALAHIATYGSKHSECIISEDQLAIETFQKEVDAACVYGNVSTAFTDGGQFGFGAEIGISTQKLHARGPMALPELTTYKYLITGDGQVRE